MLTRGNPESKCKQNHLNYQKEIYHSLNENNVAFFLTRFEEIEYQKFLLFNCHICLSMLFFEIKQHLLSFLKFSLKHKRDKFEICVIDLKREPYCLTTR